MKLHQIPDAPLAWGCAGNPELIQKFSVWLEQYQWPPSNWATFEGHIRAKLADLNREERAFVERSGAQWSSDFGVTCLVGGWLHNEPHIVSLYHDGVKGSLENNEFDHIGSDSTFATVSYYSLSYVTGMPQEVRAHIVLHATSQLAPRCGLPYNLWRITHSGIEEIPMPEGPARQ